MAPIVHTVEIARSPEDVFAYMGELERHGEWQDQIVSVKVETDGPTRAGSRATEVRRVPGMGMKVTSTYEITEWDPPRKASFRVINGPVRPFGTVTVEPAGDGARVTLEIDLEGRGVGKLLAPLGMRDMRKRVPADQARLKERLERSA